MKRNEIVKNLESAIKAEMIRIYTDYENMYSVIYVTEDGDMFTKQFLSENYWLTLNDQKQLYPVFGLNPCRFEEDENPSEDDLKQWAETEYQNALYWAKCADLSEE